MDDFHLGRVSLLAAFVFFSGISESAFSQFDNEFGYVEGNVLTLLANNTYRALSAPNGAPSEVNLYSIPVFASANSVTTSGRFLTTISLSRLWPISIDIGRLELSPSSYCLALVDNAGVPIRIAHNGRFSFMTEVGGELKLAAEDSNRLQAHRDSISGLREAINAAQSRLTSHAAWNGHQCSLTPAPSVPPAPTSGLSNQVALSQSRGYCIRVLGDQLQPKWVFEATIAMQEYEYKSDFLAYSKNPAACTRKAYEYPPDLVQQIRFAEAFTPQQTLNRQILSLLQGCVASTFDRCTGGLLTWQREAESIKEQPRKLMEECESISRGIALQREKLGNLINGGPPSPASETGRYSSTRNIGRIALSRAQCK